MATGKVTLTSIAKLQGWLWDDRVIGFGARRQRNHVHYYVRYRQNGSQIIKSIGRHGALTPETARTRAKELLGLVAGGADPFPSPEANGLTLGSLFARYLDRKRSALRARSFSEAQRYLLRLAAPLHGLGFGEVNRREIAELLGVIEDASGAASRNHVRTALSAFWRWAIAEGYTETNPVQGTLKAARNGSRERVLTQDELRKLWAALRQDRFGDIVRLLLLTAQRRNEIGHLRWNEIDLTRKMIVLPPERTKNGRQHELPLSCQALAILERQPRSNSSAFLFSDVQGFKDWGAKEALDGRAEIAPWVLHDLRRSAATYMAELGVQPHIIEAVLNHVSGHKAGVAGIYNRAKYADEMREALQRWADHVEALVGPRKLDPTGLMERAFAVARGGKIVPNDDLANLTRHLKKPMTH